MVRRLLLGATCALLLAGCGGKPDPAEQASAEKARVEATTAAFHQALRTNDVPAFMSYVDEDVVMAPPGDSVVRGRAALQAWYAAFLSKYKTTSLNLKDVAPAVLQAQSGVPPGSVAVVISADRNVKYETVVKVMDTLQRAGVQRVGLSVQISP